jgi:hypothetical protein
MGETEAKIVPGVAYMAAGTSTAREMRRGARPGNDTASRRTAGHASSVAGALALAAGYGLVLSVIIVFSVERVFGSTGAVARMTMLAVTVGVLVVGAGIGCALRRTDGGR